MAYAEDIKITSPELTFNDGNKIPQLGFGVYKVEDEVAEETVTNAFEVGFRHIDTAHLYQNERGVGRAIKASKLPRDEIFITTKVWNDDHGRDKTRAAIEASLEKLGLDYVDLYLIHWPMPMNGLYVETWKTLVELKAEGLAKSIGVSNFPASLIDELIGATEVTPVINQVELNPYFAQPELRVENTKRGILTESWAPLARGKELFDDPAILAIAEKHQATAAQVVIAWHLAISNVVIPKTVTKARIKENFEALRLKLDSEDIEAINLLNRGLSARQGPDPETMERN